MDPRNRQLMLQHITCASAELPVLMEEDQAFFGPGLPAAARFLQASGAQHPGLAHSMLFQCQSLRLWHGG